MAANRIVYQNWIVDIGRDPDNPTDAERTSDFRSFLSLDRLISGLNGNSSQTSTSDQSERARLIIERVTAALEQLSEDEREFVERFYFIGQSYHQISEKSGRDIHRLEALHKRAIRKLRKQLASTVKELFGIESNPNNLCIICSSGYRKEIDHLIASRDPKRTWRPVMKLIKDKFGISITAPQILIGHMKYH